MKYFFTSMFILLLLNPAYAWTPDQCSVVLKFGIYDSYDVVEYNEKYRMTKSLYCEQRADSGSLDLVVPNYFDLKGGQTSTKDFCKSSDDEYKETYFYQQAKQTVNSNIVSAFSDCIKQKAGTTFVLYTSSDPSVFNVRFTFSPFGNITDEVVRVLVNGATCSSPVLDNATASGVTRKFPMRSGSVDLLCERDANKTVQISAAVEKGEVSTNAIILPAYKAPAPPPTEYTFYGPQVDGIALDVCAGWSKSCERNNIPGLLAADMWCHKYGFGDATNASIVPWTPPTRVIGSGQICNTVCTRVETLTCATLR